MPPPRDVALADLRARKLRGLISSEEYADSLRRLTRRGFSRCYYCHVGGISWDLTCHRCAGSGTIVTFAGRWGYDAPEPPEYDLCRCTSDVEHAEPECWRRYSNGELRPTVVDSEGAGGSG